MGGQIIPLYPDSGTDAARVQGIPVSVVDPTSGQILEYDSTTQQYVPTDYVAKAGGTFTGNVTLNGTANTAPNQTAASGSSLMTRDLTDTRYGSVSVLTLANNLTSNSTNNVNSTETITLSAGTYICDFVADCGTASTTGGVNAGLTLFTYTRFGGVYSRQLATTENATTMASSDARSYDSYIADAPFGDAPNKTVRGIGSFIFTITTQQTFGVRVRQRSATDAINPAYIKNTSFWRFIKIA